MSTNSLVRKELLELLATGNVILAPATAPGVLLAAGVLNSAAEGCLVVFTEHKVLDENLVQNCTNGRRIIILDLAANRTHTARVLRTMLSAEHGHKIIAICDTHNVADWQTALTRAYMRGYKENASGEYNSDRYFEELGVKPITSNGTPQETSGGLLYSLLMPCNFKTLDLCAASVNAACGQGHPVVVTGEDKKKEMIDLADWVSRALNSPLQHTDPLIERARYIADWLSLGNVKPDSKIEQWCGSMVSHAG